VTKEHHLRREERPDSGLVEELRCDAAGELLDLAGQLTFLAGELPYAPCESFERELGATDLGIGAPVGSRSGQAGEQPGTGERAQLTAGGFGGSDQQVAQLRKRCRLRAHGAFAGCHQRAQGLAFATSARNRGPLLGEHGPGGAHSVECV
jgi:hypothetical protein